MNWNGWSDTVECLESLRQLDYPNFEIIVCDNDSSDGSLAKIRDWLKEHWTTPHDTKGGAALMLSRAEAEHGAGDAGGASAILIQTGGNLGFAGGNNVGLRYLARRGDVGYVWLLNNDTVVGSGALRELVNQALATSTVGAVGGMLLEYHAPDRIQDTGGANFSPWHGMVTRIEHGAPATDARTMPDRLDFISGGCMLVPVEVLDRVGLLDERFFMYGEDADWCTRMRHAGLSLAYAPKAEIWHKGGGSAVRGSATHDYHNAKSSLLLIDKHYRLRLPLAFCYALYRCVLPKVARRQWSRLGTVTRAYRDFFRERRSQHRDEHVAIATQVTGSWRANVA